MLTNNINDRDRAIDLLMAGCTMSVSSGQFCKPTSELVEEEADPYLTVVLKHMGQEGLRDLAIGHFQFPDCAPDHYIYHSTVDLSEYESDDYSHEEE